MADLGEHLLRELRLEGQDEARRGLAGRVRDDVELDRDLVGAHAREGIRTALRSLAWPPRPAPRHAGRHRGGGRRLEGVAVAHAAPPPAARRRPLRQAGEPPAHRLVQVPRRLQRALVDPARAARERRRRRLEREPRAGRRGGRSAARRPRDDRDARQRGAGEGRPHRRAGAPRSCAARARATSGSASRPSCARSAALEYIPPFDDARIIAGQGTVGLELVERTPRGCDGRRPRRRRRPGLGRGDGGQGAPPGRAGRRRRAGAGGRRAAVAARGPHRPLAGGRRDADDLRRRPHAGARRAHVRRHLGARGRDRDRDRGGRARRDAHARARGEAPRRADRRAAARGGRVRGRRPRRPDRARALRRQRRPGRCCAAVLAGDAAR